MLGLGAVPALGTFYLRRQIAETPRFALAMQGDVAGAACTVDMVKNGRNGKSATTANAQSRGRFIASTADLSAPGGGAENVSTLKNDAALSKSRPARSWLYLLLTKRYLPWIIGTAGAWFLLDIAYYGTTISSPLVLGALNPKADLITNMFYTLIIFVVAALPGYIVAILTID